MKAIVVQPFSGRRDDEGHSTAFQPGDVVRGSLAEVACDNGWAEELGDEEAERIEAMTEEERAALRAQAAEAGAPRKKSGRKGRGEAEA